MILVTGGAGLVGKELIIQLLAQGKRVKAIYNKTRITGITDTRLVEVQCDILDVIRLEEIMEGVDEVYHCAGLVAFAPKELSRLFKINVEGTANMVNAALNTGVRKMLHVSSIAALGRPVDPNKLSDEKMDFTTRTDTSNYGKSKFLGELEIWRGIAEGLPAVIINPSLIIGAGNWDEGSTELFKSVYNEFPWFTEGTTGFVDVRDVAKAMIMLMASDITSQRFIVSAENALFKNVLGMIAKGFNKKPASRKVTPFLAAFVWRLEALKCRFTGKAPMVTKETAATAMATQKFNNNKLTEWLPSFSYHALPDTISYTCAALQQKLNKH